MLFLHLDVGGFLKLIYLGANNMPRGELGVGGN